MSTHLILGRTGTGKTHQLQQLIDQAASDPAIATWVIEPAGRNGLTGADRHATTDTAEQLLTDALAIIDQRHVKQHIPTEAEPRIRVLIDAAEHLLRHQTSAADLLYRVVVTGRAAAVDTAVTASEMYLDVWPYELRNHYLRGDLTVLGHPQPNWLPEVRDRIADGTATVIHRPSHEDQS
jgi:hypothetical protein